jgi:hypothetical protein
MARLTGAFMESLKTRHTAITGATRCGKTYLVGHILEELQNDGVHTIFVDPKHDSDYENLGEICTTPMQVYSKLMAKCPRIVFRTDTDDCVESLDKVIRLLVELQRSDGFKRIRRVIAIDEIQTYVGKGKMKAVEMIWTMGAGIGIVGMALTQRLQLLNETVWSQSENRIMFRMEESMKYFKDKGVDHYPIEELRDDMNKYYFYATTGGGNWKMHDPIDKSKWQGPLTLSRW